MMVRAAEYIQLLVRVGRVYHRENVYSRSRIRRDSLRNLPFSRPLSYDWGSLVIPSTYPSERDLRT